MNGGQAPNWEDNVPLNSSSQFVCGANVAIEKISVQFVATAAFRLMPLSCMRFSHDDHAALGYALPNVSPTVCVSNSDSLKTPQHRSCGRHNACIRVAKDENYVYTFKTNKM